MTEIIDKLGKIEYVVEGAIGAATDGVFPTNPTMLWIGEVTSARLTSTHQNEDVRGLKAAAATNKLAIVGNVKTGTDMVLEIEYAPQNWTLAKFASALAGGLTPTDTMSSLSFGLIGQASDGTETYAKVSGGVIESMDVECAEDKKFKVTLRIPVKDIYLSTNDPWTTDYKGSGAHATALTTNPLVWSDISAVTRTSAIVVSSLKWSVKNQIDKSRDPASTFVTKIKSLTPTKREYTLSAKLKRTAQNDFAVAHNAYAAVDFVIVVNGVTITFVGSKLPKEIIEFGDSGLSEFDADFTGITSMTYSA